MSQIAGLIKLCGEEIVLVEIAEIWRLRAIDLKQRNELDSAGYYSDLYYRLSALMDVVARNPFGSPTTPETLEELQTVFRRG